MSSHEELFDSTRKIANLRAERDALRAELKIAQLAATQPYCGHEAMLLELRVEVERYKLYHQEVLLLLLNALDRAGCR